MKALPQNDRFEEASVWQLRIAQNPALERSVAFLEWISDPENLQAFGGVNAAWTAADDFSVEPRILDMRQAALRRARQAGTSRWAPTAYTRRAIAATLLVALAGSTAAYYYLSARDVY